MTARAGRRPLPARPADTPRPAFRPARFSGIAGYRLQSRELTSCVPADEPEAQIRHPIVIGETLGECLVTGLQVMLVVTHRLTLRQGPANGGTSSRRDASAERERNHDRPPLWLGRRQIQPDLALRLLACGDYALAAGQVQAAVEGLVEAIELFRPLAEADPARYQLALAVCLNILGISHAESGKAEKP